MKRLLFIARQFPDRDRPERGLPNVRLAHQLGRDLDISVIAPQPLLPWMRKTRTARQEDDVLQPRFPRVHYLPRIGAAVNHMLCRRALRRSVVEAVARGGAEAILCAWLYPDGWAAARLAAEVQRPLVLVAQGSDVNIGLRKPVVKRAILDACDRAEAVITRSRALADRLATAGVRDAKLRVVYNGVDPELYCVGAQAEARRELSLDMAGLIVLFVGYLRPVKDPLLAAAAVRELRRRRPGAQLVVVGAGRLADALRHADADAPPLLVGHQPPERVVRYMQAADVLCVSSRAEGVPNVVLEALATGLPVAATPVGGLPEIIDDAAVGALASSRAPANLAAALAAALQAPGSREARAVACARRFSWSATADAYRRVLCSEPV